VETRKDNPAAPELPLQKAPLKEALRDARQRRLSGGNSDVSTLRRGHQAHQRSLAPLACGSQGGSARSGGTGNGLATSGTFPIFVDDDLRNDLAAPKSAGGPKAEAAAWKAEEAKPQPEEAPLPAATSGQAPAVATATAVAPAAAAAGPPLQLAQHRVPTPCSGRALPRTPPRTPPQTPPRCPPTAEVRRVSCEVRRLSSDGVAPVASAAPRLRRSSRPSLGGVAPAAAAPPKAAPTVPTQAAAAQAAPATQAELEVAPAPPPSPPRQSSQEAVAAEAAEAIFGHVAQSHDAAMHALNRRVEALLALHASWAAGDSVGVLDTIQSQYELSGMSVLGS